MNRHLDRSHVTLALVERLVATQFPRWAGLPVKPVDLGGWDNITFRLGSDMSVRLPSADSYTAQVDKEHRWLPHLAPKLPLPIPAPLARGDPSRDFPRPWSVYRWLEGTPATSDGVADPVRFARDLAGFLRALYAIDPDGGPAAGAHSHRRGQPVEVLDEPTRAAIAALDGQIDADAATATWQEALEASAGGPPSWVHGDVAASNLLVIGGQLAAVIDFGCCSVGDMACDLPITWTFFEGESRDAFKQALGLSDEVWARARGWALWKALIELQAELDGAGTEPVPAWARMGWRKDARGVIADVAHR